MVADTYNVLACFLQIHAANSLIRQRYDDWPSPVALNAKKMAEQGLAYDDVIRCLIDRGLENFENASLQSCLDILTRK